MLRALIFLIKAGLLVALAVWVSMQNGSAKIAWGPYTVMFPHIGYFLLAVGILILLGIFIYNVIRTFAGFPSSYRRYREVKRQQEGYRALTLGLTAVAAGDKKAASYQSHRAGELLSGDTGLPLLLKAQTAKLKGQEEEAQQIFLALTQDKEAGFLGVRGLLQGALDARNYRKALDLTHQALGLHPKQGWILKLAYELEVRLRAWDQAQKTLYRAEKAQAIPSEQASRDRIAILLALAQESWARGFRDQTLAYLKQAHKYDLFFVPTALSLAKFYKQDGNRRRAVSVIEQAWRKNPHPDLARQWESLISPQKASKPGARMQWAEKLMGVNTQNAESHLFAGRVAMEEGLWGEARQHFRQAESLEASARLYRLWAELEKRPGGNAQLAQSLQEKAVTAPQDRHWVCRQSGRVYEEWQPVAEPHGSFNTIGWDFARPFSGPLLMEQSVIHDAVLEAPRSYSMG